MGTDRKDPEKLPDNMLQLIFIFNKPYDQKINIESIYK